MVVTMPRNYPLTWLFIVATVCVDAAVLFSTSAGSVSSADTGLRFYAWNYAIPAQFSCLAVWAVYGTTHRLAKAAWVTLACGLLLVLTWHTVEPSFRVETISFNFIQLFAVLLGVGLLRAGGVGRHLADSIESLRFSLVEIFGWTMVVALWAFALRFAGVNFIIDAYWWVWIATASIAPLVVTPILFANLSLGSRPFALLAAYLFTLIAYAIGRRFMNGPMPLWALSMAITQITYISAWWAVVRTDEVMQERRAVTAASSEKLKVFDPQDP
jgi:hypothetical protein